MALEDVHELMTKFKHAAIEVVNRFGGDVIHIHGDGMLVAFGFSNPQENDPIRAGDAALALHEAVRGITLDVATFPEWFRPRLHSGIHAGMVDIGIGDRGEGNFELVGDAANTSSKLCAIAGEDEIVASVTTLGDAESFFVTQAIDDVTLSRHRKRIPAIKIVGRSVVDRRYDARSRRGLTGFVGRDRELQILRNKLFSDVLADGKLKVVAIVGDQGVGKSRVAEQFLSEIDASDVGLHRGYCENFRSENPLASPTAAPLQPFLQMLRNLFEIDHNMSAARSTQMIEDRLETLAPGMLGRQPDFQRMLSLTPSRGSAADSDSEQRAIGAITDLFRELASRRARLLFVDDWQWADNASRQMMANLIRGAADYPVLILTTSRDLDPSDPMMRDSEVLTIEPFQAAHTERLIRRLVSGWLSPGFVEKVHAQSGGNPLYIEEICRSLDVESFRAMDDRAVHGGAVPEWLRGLIEARVEALPPDQMELLRMAAVVGNVVPIWLLADILGRRLDHGLIEALEERDLMYAGESQGTLRFKHGITRDVVYNLIGKERRRLHLRIAKALETAGGPGGRDELFEALAYHYDRGADNEQAVYYAELAGDKAMAHSAMDRACEQYGAALRALERLEGSKSMQRRWLRISRSWALPTVYNPDASVLPILHRTLQYATDLDSKDDLAHAHYWLAYMNYSLGDLRAAMDHSRQAIRHASSVPNERLAAQSLAVLGQSHAAACDYTPALSYLDESISIKQRNPSRTNLPVGSSYANAAKALVIGDIGDFDTAMCCIETALAPFAGMDHEIASSILNIRCAIHLWRGEWDKVHETAVTSQRIAEKVSLHYNFAMSRAVDAYAKCMMHGARAGVADLLQTIEYMDRHTVRLFISLPYGWLTDALVSIGDHRGARIYAEKALALAEKGDRLGEAMTCRALARAAAGAASAGGESAEFYIERAFASARARNSRHELAATELQIAELALELGDRSRATDLLTHAANEFAEMGMTWHRARAEALAEGRLAT
jgi:class 3 adenylate cyclase/tetratricopeptide (TPR) repeat protein